MPNIISRNFSTQPESNEEYGFLLGSTISDPSCCLIPNLCGLAGSALQFGLCCPIATTSMFIDFSTNRYFTYLDRFTNETLRLSTFGLVGLNMSQDHQHSQTTSPSQFIHSAENNQLVDAQLVMATPAVRRPINFVDEFLRAPNIFIDDPVTKSFLYEDRQIVQETVNNSFGTVNRHNKIFLEFVKKSFDFNQSKNEEEKKALANQLNQLKVDLNLNLSELKEHCNDHDLKNRIEKNADIFLDCCQNFGEKISNCEENQYKSFNELIMQKLNIEAHQRLIGSELLTLPRPTPNDKEPIIFKSLAQISNPIGVSNKK